MKSEESTQYRQAGRELCGDAVEYRILIEEASDGIHTYDLHGNIIDSNSKLCEMLGYTKSELLHLNVKDLIPAEDLILNPIRFDDLKAGKTLIRERRLLHKDGSVLHVEISGRLIREGVLQSIIRDISERKNAEEKLRQNEERLRNLFEASQDGIVVEENEIITYVNKSYTKMFGYDECKELVGQHISMVISSEDVDRVTQFGRNRLDGGQSPVKYEFKGKRKNGSLIAVEASVSTSNVGGHVYITTMIRDITERQRMEMLIAAQKQSLEMVVKGSPLTAVLNYLAQVIEQQSDGQTAASILLLNEHGRFYNGASPSLSEKYLRAINNLKADLNVGTCSAAAASKQTVITPDIAADPNWRGLAHLPLEEGFKSAWSMPIMSRNGDVLGTFGSYFRECREPSAKEFQAVEILASTAALAIEGKKMEKELRSSENQLRLIADTIPLLISYVDNDLRYRFVNQTYIDWFEKKREKIIGRHLPEVLGKVAFRKLLPEIERALSGEEVVFERLIPYKSGEKFVHCNYIPKFDPLNGKVLGFYAFVQDISERKRTQEELRRSRDQMEIRVRERTHELEESNQARINVLQQLMTAQEDERQRIARDLHDQLGQQMTALRLKLEILKKLGVDNALLSEQIIETIKIARQIDSDVDFLAWQLRPAALDDLGIIAALDYYIKQWSKNFDIPASFDAKRLGRTRLAPDVETTLYRIAQEALNNVFKHAHADRVNVFLEAGIDFVVLIIEDKGSGFENSEQPFAIDGAKNLGLIGMRERAALAGGSLEIETAIGEGTTIYAKFPISGKSKGEENE